MTTEAAAGLVPLPFGTANTTTALLQSAAVQQCKSVNTVFTYNVSQVCHKILDCVVKKVLFHLIIELLQQKCSLVLLVMHL